ncbi:MAG: class A beta-lactamase-related serine hydrolase [Flavobacteriales bacterium]|nr:class A beta-lactamase-related serine hydrolase [Flavobacteriales bacterium]
MARWIGVVGLIVAVAIASFYVGHSGVLLKKENVESRPVSAQTQETRVPGKHKFINPLLECDSYTPSDALKDKQLRSKLNEFTKEIIHDGRVNSISVYYRDLNNGPWIGINEKEVFSPASLLKVTFLIGALKYSEVKPEFLQKQIVFDSESIDEYTANISDEMIELGKSYRVLDLLERMIIKSDNNAKNLILRELVSAGFTKVLWADLGMEEPNASTPDDFLTIKEYSSFFRILYNSTYLSQENSQLALEILSRSNFKDGLRAGLPEGTIVSSKFGERGSVDSDIKQLHDCGIIYDDKSPYLLCVMTRGNDWQQQAQVIKDISTIVFENR